MTLITKENLMIIMNFRTQILILIVSGIIVIPIVASFNQEESNFLSIEIQEDMVFDPICLNNSETYPIVNEFCESNGDDWFMNLGVSTEFEFHHEQETLPKLLFLKLDLSDIPKSNLFTKISIISSELSIGFLYDSIKYAEEPEERFFLTYGACANSDWTEKTLPIELPCIKESGRGDMQVDSFYGIIKPDRVTKINLDLKQHVDVARKVNLQNVTEIISFSSGLFTDNLDYVDTKRECLKSSTTVSEKNRCIKISQLFVYSSEFSLLAFKPFLSVEYYVEPSIITKSINTVIFAVYPIVASFLIYRRGQENIFKTKMIKVCESLEHEVQDTYIGLNQGIKNIRPTTVFLAEFDKDYEPIKFKLGSPITEVSLLTDAYSSIINSGSFENFTKDHQIDISTLYGWISEYNKTLELIYQTIENARMSTEPKDRIEKLEWGLRTNLKIYLRYLSELRLNILAKINVKDGINDILTNEKTRFQ